LQSFLSVARIITTLMTLTVELGETALALDGFGKFKNKEGFICRITVY
jgi:hypothetical protein